MTSIRATVRNGKIETDHPIHLPEGTPLTIQWDKSRLDEGQQFPPDPEDPVWDQHPQGFEAWLEWLDTLEPSEYRHHALT